MIKVRKNKLIYTFAVMILLSYAFSGGSWANLIPYLMWVILLASTIAILLFNRGIKIRNISGTDLLTILVLIIPIVWNNWDFRNGTYSWEFVFAIILLFFLYAKDTDIWFENAIKFMIFWGLFYAFWTIISFFIPSVYSGFVYPFVSSLNPTMYATSYVAGLTNHYSVNGMFLSSSLCVYTGYYFFDKAKKKNIIGWIIFLLIVIALLLTGKRGPVLCLIMAFVVTYYFYNSNKPISRLFKIVLILIVGCVVFYIISLFIPAVLSFVNRFITQAQKGDITTHRIELWAEAYIAFLKNPITGNGWFWFKYHNSFGTDLHVHNCYLQFLCEVGIMGSIVFYSFLGIFTYQAIVLVQKTRRGIILMNSNDERNIVISLFFIVYFLIFAFEGTVFFEAQTLIPYMMMCAAVSFYWRKYIRIRVRKK